MTGLSEPEGAPGPGEKGDSGIGEFDMKIFRDDKFLFGEEAINTDFHVLRC